MLFRSLDEQAPGLIARWTMKSGEIFDMAVPDRDDISEETFSASIGFPFEFGDIKELTFIGQIGPDNMAIRNNLSSVKAVLLRLDGFDWREDIRRIVVQPCPSL